MYLSTSQDSASAPEELTPSQIARFRSGLDESNGFLSSKTHLFLGTLAWLFRGACSLHPMHSSSQCVRLSRSISVYVRGLETVSETVRLGDLLSLLPGSGMGYPGFAVPHGVQGPSASPASLGFDFLTALKRSISRK